MEPEQVSTEQTQEFESINSLIPYGIENLVLSCVICAKPVPARRASSRSKDTCGPECNAVLRKFRKWKLESSHCPACYHPSTPEQRKEFIQWRKWRGDRRDKVGRPPVKREEALRLALQEAVGLLKQELEVLLESHCTNDESGQPDRATLDQDVEQEVSQIEALIERSEKLIDSRDAEQSTLAPSGPSA